MPVGLRYRGSCLPSKRRIPPGCSKGEVGAWPVRLELESVELRRRSTEGRFRADRDSAVWRRQAAPPVVRSLIPAGGVLAVGDLPLDGGLVPWY
jgi:hypothetical protein